jgi:nicotinamidase-related amidase
MEHAYGLEIPQDLAEACTPRRTALLVYDLQVGIVSQIVNGAAVVAQVKSLLEVARAAGLRVFFMRHLSLPKEASPAAVCDSATIPNKDLSTIRFGSPPALLQNSC